MYKRQLGIAQTRGSHNRGINVFEVWYHISKIFDCISRCVTLSNFAQKNPPRNPRGLSLKVVSLLKRGDERFNLSRYKTFTLNTKNGNAEGKNEQRKENRGSHAYCTTASITSSSTENIFAKYFAAIGGIFMSVLNLQYDSENLVEHTSVNRICVYWD